jgi:dipeptidyl aminopeptidase/acylaminoacyl peptidase
MRTRSIALVFALTAACSGAQRASTTPAFTWRPRSGPAMEQLLNVHRASAPTVSPDGRSVAFLSDPSGLPQPWAITVGADPVAESAWRRLVTDPERVQFVRYAPDGRWLFMGRDHGGDENTQLLRAPASGGAATDLTAAPEVKHLFGALSHDGRWVAYASNARSRGDFDVYVRPAGDEPSAPRRVLEGAGHHEVIDFSLDGRQLAVLHERSNFDQDVLVVDVAAATARNLTPHPTEGDVRYTSPRFTRDGRSLFVVSDRGREHMNLALLDLAAPPPALPRFVLDEAHDLDLLELSPDGATLAAVYNLDGWSQLRLYDVTDPAHPRERARPDVPPGVIASLSFAGDGHSLVFDLSRAASPEEVFGLDVATNRVSRLTRSDHAGIDESALVEPTLERVRSFDGTEVSLLLYRPRDLAPGERAPVVVQVHGGPEAQFTPYFSPVIQYLVGHGYIVAAPNVRGSTGYGKRFAHLDDVALREDSVRDLAAVNRWLRARPDVAADRIAVMGGSYGGYMVLAALTLDPELWAAGCDIVGIANFRTFLERTALYRRALREAEYGSLANDGELLDRISPIHRVDRIRAPLFVIHGANDPRVPVTEAEQIVAALRQRNHRVEYLRFENEGHGVSRRENRIRAYGDVVRFFDEVLGGARAQTPPTH